jgi:hypothetical protein
MLLKVHGLRCRVPGNAHNHMPAALDGSLKSRTLPQAMKDLARQNQLSYGG